MKNPIPKYWPDTLRIALPILGGFAVVNGLVGLVGLGLTSLGIARSEAVMVTVLLASLIYLGLLIWGFHEKRLNRLGAVFLVAPACLIATATLFSHF